MNAVVCAGGITKPTLKPIIRPLDADEKAGHARIREQVMKEFPPMERRRPVCTGIVNRSNEP